MVLTLVRRNRHTQSYGSAYGIFASRAECVFLAHITDIIEDTGRRMTSSLLNHSHFARNGREEQSCVCCDYEHNQKRAESECRE
jgi:hypothetical protein